MPGVPVPSERTDLCTTPEVTVPSSAPQMDMAERVLPQVAPAREPAAPHPLADEVRRALAATGYTWLRRVVVTTAGGNVVLSGTVPNYYFKQLAQVTVMAVPGVEGVRDDLAVAVGA